MSAAISSDFFNISEHSIASKNGGYLFICFAVFRVNNNCPVIDRTWHCGLANIRPRTFSENEAFNTIFQVTKR
jgi:hypothetical protein